MESRDQTSLPAPSPRAPRKVTWGWLVGLATWLTVSAIALTAVARYAAAPGAAAQAPRRWPAESRFARTPGRATLVMIAHTKCACTRASVHELERVMAHAGKRADALVVFVGPREVAATDVLDLRATARAIDGVRVIEDEAEARLFAAATSGQVLLYDEGGTLVFQGGLTSARGHEGESVGGAVVRRHVSGGRDEAPGRDSGADLLTTDVFGCALLAPAASAP